MNLGEFLKGQYGEEAEGLVMTEPAFAGPLFDAQVSAGQKTSADGDDPHE